MTKVTLTVLVIAFVTVAVKGATPPELPAELQDAAKAARAACVEETGATTEMLEKAATGEFVEDEQFKCYFKCVMDKFSLIEDDAINFEAMLQLVPESIKETKTPLIQKCREETGKDVCEQALNFNKCLYKENPETYIVI